MTADVISVYQFTSERNTQVFRVHSLTSSSERYISNQFEKMRSMELSSITRSGDVTSAHMKDAFL
jgi:hypothetical protein